MTEYRKYIRDLNKKQINDLSIRHKFHMKNKGFLTKRQKERLLKQRKKEKGTLDSEFWYRLKHSAKMAIFDLQLISEIADESQLEEIFEPLTTEDYRNMDKGKYHRTDLRHLIENIFRSHSPEKSHSDDWRFKIALDMVKIGTGYFQNMPAFQSKLHKRLFEDVIDTLQGYRDSTKSGFAY